MTFRKSLIVAMVIGFILGVVSHRLGVGAAGPAPLPVGVVSHLAHVAAAGQGLSDQEASRLVCLAWVESGYRPSAASPDGQYVGLLAFGQPLWERYAPGLGYPADRWAPGAATNASAALNVAAFIVARPAQTGGWRHWPAAVDGRCP